MKILVLVGVLITLDAFALWPPIDWDCRKTAMSELRSVLRRTASRLGNSRYFEIERACIDYCTKLDEAVEPTKKTCLLPKAELEKVEETLLSAHRLIPTLLHRPQDLSAKAKGLSERAKRVLAEASLSCNMRAEEFYPLLDLEPKTVVKSPSTVTTFVKFGPVWLKIWASDELVCIVDRVPPAALLDMTNKYSGCNTMSLPPYSCDPANNPQLHGLQKLRFINQVQPKD